MTEYALDDISFKLVKPLRWRPLAEPVGKDVLEYWNDHEQRWYSVAPWARGVFEGLDAGDDEPGVVRRVLAAEPALKNEIIARFVTRSFFSVLRGLGHIEIPVTPPPPTVCDGRFALGKELGRGGVAIAYSAVDRDSGAKCVVKRPWGFFSPIATASEWQREEGDTLRRFDHPRIVRFLAQFEEGGLWWLARGFGEGRDLFTARGPSASLTTEGRARVHRQVADTIAHAHSRGVLLVDIKPTNYAISENGDVTLIDAGNAVVAPDLYKVLAHRVGTREFTAPETSKQKIVSARSDVWSFGRTVASIALGAHLRTAWGYDGVLRELAAAPQVTDGERELVRRCTAAEPAERPASIAEAVRLLS